jgi:hypothetical protein
MMPATAAQRARGEIASAWQARQAVYQSSVER